MALYALCQKAFGKKQIKSCLFINFHSGTKEYKPNRTYVWGEDETPVTVPRRSCEPGTSHYLCHWAPQGDSQMSPFCTQILQDAFKKKRWNKLLSGTIPLLKQRHPRISINIVCLDPEALPQSLQGNEGQAHWHTSRKTGVPWSCTQATGNLHVFTVCRGWAI